MYYSSPKSIKTDLEEGTKMSKKSHSRLEISNIMETMIEHLPRITISPTNPISIPTKKKRAKTLLSIPGQKSIVKEIIENAPEIIITVNNCTDTFTKDVKMKKAKEVIRPQLGDHIFTYHMDDPYTHHGIYIGKKQVIHYASAKESLDIEVRIDDIHTFCNGKKLLKKSKQESPIKFPKHIVVKRALSRLKENDYNLIISNCEHFARWCRAGDNMD